MANSIFSTEALNKVVTDTLATANIPEGHKNAVVFGVDDAGAKVVAHFKLGQGDVWTLDGVYQHTWQGDNKIGGQLVASW